MPENPPQALFEHVLLTAVVFSSWPLFVHVRHGRAPSVFPATFHMRRMGGHTAWVIACSLCSQTA